MHLDPQASELNEVIQHSNPAIFSLLSEKGRAIYFPKLGILSQSAEARDADINATIGTALEDDGTPMRLESIAQCLGTLNPHVFNYAPSAGQPEIRRIWKEMTLKKNPSLRETLISLPVVTCALTHGLSMAGYLFVNPYDIIIIPNLYWENYDLTFSLAYGAQIRTFPLFEGDGFNVVGLRSALAEGAPGKKIVLLNFPNNPTGYTCTVDEAHQIRDVLVSAARSGNTILALIDDAYFGLVFENGVMTESIFALLADAHERILAVKFDGPTKEDYAWGLRIGFVTFGCAGANPLLYGALEAKLAGAIRGNISNSSNVAQMLLLHAYGDKNYDFQRAEKYEILKRRYLRIKETLAAHPEYSKFFTPLPFNSGYFMCVQIRSGDAEKVRQVLLKKFRTGVIVVGNCLRIAFSSTPLEKIDRLLENIYAACVEVDRHE